MDVRIWFNRIWPARVHLIPMLRENPDHARVRVYGTHPDRAAPALTACDEVELEPVEDEAFFDFAIDFCRRHGIDVVMPSSRLVAFADHAEAFAAIGTKVMCAPADTLRTVTDKSRMYAAVERTRVPLAPWRVVSDADGLRKAVEEFAETGSALCVKPAGEYSAYGFRRLDDSPLEVSDFERLPQPTASVAAVADALQRALDRGDPVPELIVMPYLDSPEISVDCLSEATGTLVSAIARAKAGRVRTLLDDPEVTEFARQITGHFRLAYLSNVQFRHWQGRPVLLEVNARPAAGIYQTRMTGVNLAWAAVRMLLYGDPGDLPKPSLGGRLAVVEHAIALSEPVQAQVGHDRGDCP
ncbi:ATP-grasp domain-containing protein [Kitasatospora atroaurantiaca]|uniref:ATP-grasp domain-containing protein n=1 Tax=Kitasatospora atroaurantiaca TaxID=285545 RepID=UPI001FEA6426|nr:ATP-grasp domain-containing protein [Kitasatospora atroaurantiaca]